MDKTRFSTPIDLKAARITGGFWRTAQETVRTEVIPYQWQALNDRVPGAAPSYCMHNFRAAARLQQRRRTAGEACLPHYTDRGFEVLPDDPANPDPDKFYGFVFQDTDFSKWIEAVAYTLTWHPDPELERTADEAIDLVCAAQDESGYLDTYYILGGMDGAFTNLKDHHELYCLGHLIEGAAAYYQATGKDKLLRAAERFAQCAARTLAPGQCEGYPGHEIAEMALARLYEVTGDEQYLALARQFLDRRGTQPHYFDIEAERRAAKAGLPFRPAADPLRYAYHQAHRPVRRQTEAVGHAVRAGYLYAGMADAARLTGDEELLAACKRLWRSIADKKLYVTGGMGGTAVGEAFSYEYDLPNDTAYSETCAAIALAFFARRMLELEPRAEYADVMERALYNTVLAGMALDGKSFFYVNPLEVVPAACRADSRLAHVKPVRQKWFGCACCPPNIARIVSSLAAYACTENADTLFFHLYADGTVEKKVGDKTLSLAVQTALPWDGKVTLRVQSAAPVRAVLALRLPGWCAAPVVRAPRAAERADRDGYCYLTALWQPGDTVELDLPMRVQMLAAAPAVREDQGKVAFLRGPIVYCAEQADNGPELDRFAADAAAVGAGCAGVTAEMIEICGQRMAALTVPALRRTDAPQALYADYRPPEYAPCALRLVPYYAWANRGEGEMRVWLWVK